MLRCAGWVISLQKYEGLRRHTLAPGDILFSSFVDREVRVCLFPDNLGHVAINKADCFAVRHLSRCDPQFVTFLLASTETYEAMKENVRGVTRPRIGLSQLRDYKIPLPPIAEQNRIAEGIKTVFARANCLETEAARARALLDRLETAILAKAFRGELVPQDPSEEPAHALLDRIRAERAATPSAKRGRRPRVEATSA
jgi:type I restriction enzyme S subunit